MTNPQVAPYGSWKSPITTDLMLSETVGLGHIALDGANTYWIEIRLSEGGRSVIVRRTPGGPTTDITPPSFNARTMVHEYGGGDFTVSDSIIYFSNFADQKLYRQVPESEPQPITSGENMRYADAIVDRERKRLICVREDHSAAGREAVNTLISLALDGGGDAQILVSGNDFYSSPRLSPGGSLLAWLTWNHPNMPWDGTELWVGEFQPDGSIDHAEKIAGGTGESIFQPEWSPDGVLHFVSDRTGWWNLYRRRDGHIEPLYEMAAEFGQPQWVFGMSTYGFIARDHIICKYIQQGAFYLASLNTVTGKLEQIKVPYTTIRDLYVTPEQVVFAGGSPTEPLSIVELDPDTSRTQVLRRSSSVTVDPGYLSIPESIEFPTEYGLTAYAFYYPPHNRDYVGPQSERPPLIVRSHGGPTASTVNVFNLGIQYWTSRGFAVLDVNYGGSTGYGREYRRRLEGQWGVVDIDDCVNGARYLVERGLADGNRLAIMGGSAGGYTTLGALTFRDTFKAGASHYGLSDLVTFVKDTHKFESRYLERLVGPYPEQRDLFYQRSPIHFTDRISCPVIFFQGLDDKIVPPNQAEVIVEALKKKGLPVAYIAFPGESHGFRRAENIKRAIEGELYFYSRIFDFPLAEPVEPVPIENL